MEHNSAKVSLDFTLFRVTRVKVKYELGNECGLESRGLNSWNVEFMEMCRRVTGGPIHDRQQEVKKTKKNVWHRHW